MINLSTIGSLLNVNNIAHAISSGFIPTSVLRWTLNQSSGNSATDSSGNGWTGTISGLLNTDFNWAAGDNSLNCVDFLTNQSGITGGPITQLSNVAHASLSFWVNLPASNSAFNIGCNNGVGGYNSVSMAINNGSTSTAQFENNNANFPNFTYTFTIATWYHVCITFDGTVGTAANRVVTYVNAVSQIMTQNGSGNPTSLGTSTQQGSFGVNVPAENANVYVQDVIVDNTTWTQSTVTAVYNAGAQ